MMELTSDLSKQIGEVVHTVDLPDTFSSSTLRCLYHHRVSHLLSCLSIKSNHLKHIKHVVLPCH